MSRHFIGIAIDSLKTSNAYGPGGAQAKGEPGGDAKEQSIHYAIMQGIEDATWDGETRPDTSSARAIVEALEEVGFRIIKAPAKR